jgi:hypothetical protein
LSGVAGRSGRKSRSKDIEMIQRLSPLDDIAFDKLKQGIENGQFAYLKLYFLYRFGSPIAMQEVTVTSPEVPLFQINFKSTDELNNL